MKIDYSQKDKCPECNESQQGFDWVAAGRKHQEAEHAADRGEDGYDTIIPGKVTEQRSYLRWEEPMLGINGEGRVTPLAPGCQPSVTIIGEDGKPILLNHIFKTDPGLERGGDEGQLAIDMSPTQPHTTTKNARTCESCHASRKALGLGIGGTRPWDEQHTVDLETVDGKILPEQTQPQMEPIENLDHDWSQIVDEEGKQLATVGHHFQLSRAFTKEEQLHISREGTCLACHQDIPDESLAVSFLHHVAKYTGQLPKTNAAAQQPGPQDHADERLGPIWICREYSPHHSLGHLVLETSPSSAFRVPDTQQFLTQSTPSGRADRTAAGMAFWALTGSWLLK